MTRIQLGFNFNFIRNAEKRERTMQKNTCM